MTDGQAGRRRNPSQCLGMAGVSRFPVQENRVNAVQFAMLAEQAPAIQITGGKIPDSRGYSTIVI